MWNKDPFLRIKRDVGVPIVQLEQAEAGDEEEEKKEMNVPTVPNTKSRLSRKKTTKLDLKGKCVALSPKKPKKVHVPKTIEVP